MPIKSHLKQYKVYEFNVCYDDNLKKKLCKYLNLVK